ncbi:MAG: 4Fe-4S dicluster domain-containing protein [Anaerolineae bacterium]
MTTRGTTLKTKSPRGQLLLRPMVTRRYELHADYAKCCGCSICATVCPREAITLSPVRLDAGRVVGKPQVDIDEHKCSFCGECVALCPTYALTMLVNGLPENPVLKGKAFPYLVRKNVVDVAACQQSDDMSYVDNCPVHAISATFTENDSGRKLHDVAVDQQTCINCTRCMETGPVGGFTVTKPYQGRIWLNTSLCPSGCQACADICPSHAITFDGTKVAVDRRFCLFCSACENVCPAPGAVKAVRTGFVHTPISSGAWMNAVDKLVSFKEVAHEYDVKSQAKRRKLMLAELGVADSTSGAK